MSKKNSSSRKRNTDVLITGFRPPVLHDKGKKVYVDFYVFDSLTEKWRRKKYHLDKYPTLAMKRLHGAKLASDLLEKLLQGWNPFYETPSNRKVELLETLLERYLAYISRISRVKTVQAYSSRVAILREYNNSRSRPIRYSMEFNQAFVNDFLDWLFDVRQVGVRTRNNYRGWCSAFAEFLIGRGFLESNPVEHIRKLPEPKKQRQALTPEMMQRLSAVLRKEDRPFLLAVLMEYYTLIRPTELTNLRLRDFRLHDQTVFVSGEFSKNKRDGFVGINETIIKLMLELRVFDHSGDCYLFSKGFRPGFRKVRADVFNKRWCQIREKLGWGSEFKFYSLKDSGIRDLANERGIVIARDQARHTDVSTTNRYLVPTGKVHDETKHFKGLFDLEAD